MEANQTTDSTAPLSPEKWWEWFATRSEEDKDRMVEEVLVRRKEEEAWDI